jgi:hypothetical protein
MAEMTSLRRIRSLTLRERRQWRCKFLIFCPRVKRPSIQLLLPFNDAEIETGKEEGEMHNGSLPANGRALDGTSPA